MNEWRVRDRTALSDQLALTRPALQLANAFSIELRQWVRKLVW